MSNNSTSESLRYMSITVVPVTTVLTACLYFLEDNADNTAAKAQLLRARALAYAGSGSGGDRDAQSCYEQAWQIERSSGGNRSMPASFYECALASARCGDYDRAGKLLSEGAKLLEMSGPSKSVERQRLIATELARVWTLSGEINLVRKSYEEAERCFANAITAVCLRRESPCLSTRTILRLAGRGWMRCPQCREPNGDARASALEALEARLHPADRPSWVR